MKQICKENRKFESGRSMIEMIAVIAIMGLLTASAFTLIKSGLTSQKIARTADEIDILASNVRAMTAQSIDFSSLPTTEEEGKTLAKTILKSVGTESVSPLGGTYYIMYKEEAGSDDQCKDALVVGIKSMKEAVFCETMANRSYSIGFCEAVCDDKTLEIYYTKTN